LESSEKSDILAKRLKILVNDITVYFYKNISKGLFENDKRIFAFLISAHCDLKIHAEDKELWDFFIFGHNDPSILNKDQKP
jgi:hypothetical protein